MAQVLVNSVNPADSGTAVEYVGLFEKESEVKNYEGVLAGACGAVRRRQRRYSA